MVTKGVGIDDVIEVLRSYKLLSLLPSIKKAVEQHRKAKAGNDAIFIESPFPLDDRALARIQRIAGNDLAPVVTSINQNLLAGFKARYRGTLYDGSAERIIKQLMK